MRPWTSIAFVAVVLIKWLCGKAAAERDPFCLQPENVKLCSIFGDLNHYDVQKRYLRWGRSAFGDNFLRFGRSNPPVYPEINYPSYTYRFGKRAGNEQDLFDDKGYLRFGRSWPPGGSTHLASFIRSNPNFAQWHLRLKRSAGEPETEKEKKSQTGKVANVMRKRSQRDMDNDSGFVWFGETDSYPDKRSGKTRIGFPRFGRGINFDDVSGSGNLPDKRFMRFGRDDNGWLHFGKRLAEKKSTE